MKALVSLPFPTKLVYGFGLVFAALLWQSRLTAQPNINRSTANQTATTMKMKTFVIIFRQGPHPLTEKDKQQRAEETGTWARRQNSAGHKLDPHILATESVRRGPENPDAKADGWPITALLFLEAHDLADAVQVAESHPALGYGAGVEVRPWSAPTPAAASAKTSGTL